MYSVDRLSFPECCRYEKLTFPYFRPWLQQPDLDLIAIGATLASRPVGLLLARASTEDERIGQIHSIFVSPDQRRVGVASRLLARAECELQKISKIGASITYMDSGPSTPALEALLQELGWGPPSARMLICESDFETITKAPWLSMREFPPEFEVFPWVDLTASERENLSLECGKPNSWFPEVLSPFWFDQRIEPVSSLGLRYRGDIVGWCITHRLDRETIRFARLFVRRDLQATSRAIMLLAQSIYRHESTEVYKAIFDVAAHNIAMLRFVNRRMAPYLKSMRTIRRRYKRLGAPLAQRMFA
jgi:GNAT superfamily N-acetyltransferase